jgi:hypothetical protein
MQPSLRGGQKACHYNLNHLSHLSCQLTVQALPFQHFASGSYKITIDQIRKEVQNATLDFIAVRNDKSLLLHLNTDLIFWVHKR